MLNNKFVRLLVPGLVFQSILIGGGYGTGAEIAQFFGVSGMFGGLLGAFVTFLCWSLVCAVTFEFCRVMQTFDYGSMMKHILGPWAFLYDLCYWIMFLIVMGVVNASAGAIIEKLGFNQWLGVALLSAGVLFLVFKGTEMVEKALSIWSYVLCSVYLIFMVVVFVKFGANIAAEVSKGEVADGWFMHGLQYSFYNLVVVPLVLYTVRGFKSRSESIVSGILAGFLGIFPGTMLLLTMGCDFANVVSSTVPVLAIFDRIHMPWLFWTFELVLFVTLMETATGFVKAVVDRFQVAYRKTGHEEPTWFAPAVTIIPVGLGVAVSAFGLLGLIVKGYGTACWGFLVLFALPMLTVGVYKIAKHSK